MPKQLFIPFRIYLDFRSSVELAPPRMVREGLRLDSDLRRQLSAELRRPVRVVFTESRTGSLEHGGFVQLSVGEELAELFGEVSAAAWLIERLAILIEEKYEDRLTRYELGTASPVYELPVARRRAIWATREWSHERRREFAEPVSETSVRAPIGARPESRMAISLAAIVVVVVLGLVQSILHFVFPQAPRDSADDRISIVEERLNGLQFGASGCCCPASSAQPQAPSEIRIVCEPPHSAASQAENVGLPNVVRGSRGD